MRDKIIRLLPFPNNKVKAFTMLDCDGNYNIYINSNLTVEQQQKSFLHESSHIDNGDYDYERDIQFIEMLRH